MTVAQMRARVAGILAGRGGIREIMEQIHDAAARGMRRGFEIGRSHSEADVTGAELALWAALRQHLEAGSREQPLPEAAAAGDGDKTITTREGLIAWGRYLEVRRQLLCALVAEGKDLAWIINLINVVGVDHANRILQAHETP